MQCITITGIWWFLCVYWIFYRQGCIFPTTEILLLVLLQEILSPRNDYDLELWFQKLGTHINRDQVEIFNIIDSRLI